MAYVVDVMRLARGKFDTPAVRYYYQLVSDDDGKRFGQAEVFVADRAGADVPDELKSQRCVVQVPFVAGIGKEDPTQVAAVNGLHEALQALE